jgi:hypothetical protein
MKYTEKLEALEFAISCIAANHLEHIVIGHDIASEHCWCEHGVAIRRLQDEIKTTQCALSAMAARKGKPSVKWGLRPKRTPEAKR